MSFRMRNYTENELSYFPIYFRAGNRNFVQEDIFRLSGYGYHQVFAVSGGYGILKIKGETYMLKKGDMFFLPKGLPHEYYGTDEQFLTTFLGFCGDGFSPLLSYYGLSEQYYFPQKSKGVFENHMEMLLKQYDSIHELSALCALTFSAVVAFFDEIAKKEYSPIEQVKLYLESNYMNPLTLEDLFPVYPYSRSKLCREFKETYHTTVFGMLTDIRLKNAQVLLKNFPDIKLSAVASACGFSDVSYFCRMYKKAFGHSPKTKELSA